MVRMTCEQGARGGEGVAGGEGGEGGNSGGGGGGGGGEGGKGGGESYSSRGKLCFSSSFGGVYRQRRVGHNCPRKCFLPQSMSKFSRPNSSGSTRQSQTLRTILHNRTSQNSPAGTNPEESTSCNSAPLHACFELPPCNPFCLSRHRKSCEVAAEERAQMGGLEALTVVWAEEEAMEAQKAGTGAVDAETRRDLRSVRVDVLDVGSTHRPSPIGGHLETNINSRHGWARVPSYLLECARYIGGVPIVIAGSAATSSPEAARAASSIRYWRTAISSGRSMLQYPPGQSGEVLTTSPGKKGTAVPQTVPSPVGGHGGAGNPGGGGLGGGEGGGEGGGGVLGGSGGDAGGNGGGREGGGLMQPGTMEMSP
eukprot:3885484-Prymnesium_polylepis.2